jgi:uncharacterized membrane protein YesL
MEANMKKVIVVLALLFVVAIVAPDVRGLMLVGGVGLIAGYMMGMQPRAAAEAELAQARALRLVGGAQ